MPELTPRLGIKKPLGNENVTRASFNENWDIIDSKAATVGVDGKVPTSQLPAGTANGVASLGADGKVPTSELPAMDYVPNTQKGVANGVATLGSDGKVPAGQLNVTSVNGKTAAATPSTTEKTDLVGMINETLQVANGTQVDLNNKLWIEVKRSTNQTIVTDTMTKIQFDTAPVGRQTSNWSSFRFTAPRAGIYHLDAYIVSDNVPQYTAGELYLYKNGVQNRRLDKETTPGVASLNLRGGLTLELTQNDYLELYIFANAQTAVTSVSYLNIVQLA